MQQRIYATIQYTLEHALAAHRNTPIIVNGHMDESVRDQLKQTPSGTIVTFNPFFLDDTP